MPTLIASFVVCAVVLFLGSFTGSLLTRSWLFEFKGKQAATVIATLIAGTVVGGIVFVATNYPPPAIVGGKQVLLLPLLLFFFGMYRGYRKVLP